ncbi:MAG: hypothetical protein Q9O62_03270 [Ardenticatenia bacterium]|nr:hypothetical protein [Ardenticatenia bacterium]
MSVPERSSHEFVRLRQERVLAMLDAHGIEAVVAVGRSFYDRPGMMAWLSHHFPPFPTAVFAPGVRGLGHAVFVLTPPRAHVGGGHAFLPRGLGRSRRSAGGLRSRGGHA